MVLLLLFCPPEQKETRWVQNISVDPCLYRFKPVKRCIMGLLLGGATEKFFVSSSGDVLNVDPLTFYSQLYRMLPQLHAGAPNDDIIIVLRCLDAMLTRRRKQVTLQRAMAYVKRLSTLSLHVLPNGSVGILAAARAAVNVSRRICLG